MHEFVCINARINEDGVRINLPTLNVTVGNLKCCRSLAELEAGSDDDFKALECIVVPEDAVDDLNLAVI